MNETIISVTSLKKSFKNLSVLKGIDFWVARGSIFALLGSNGAGKTTTVKILSTLIRPDGGKASVCGFDVVGQADEVREHISLTGILSPILLMILFVYVLGGAMDVGDYNYINYIGSEQRLV